MRHLNIGGTNFKFHMYHKCHRLDKSSLFYLKNSKNLTCFLNMLKIYSDELLDSLFFEVYTRINYIEDRCGVTRQTAVTYLNSLVDAGLLEFEKVGRESIYKNIRLIDLLSNF